jgi:hypothetical protein
MGGAMFTVIDRQTGKAPDLATIALNEAWAHNLCYCDMDGFALTEDDCLILLDECGKHVSCPAGRFDVRTWKRRKAAT